MADGDTQELKLHIVTDADNKGFRDTATAGKDLSASMGVINVSAADVEKALGKTEKAAELNHRQMRALASTLGRDIPGGGELFEAAFASMESEEGKMMGATFLLIGGLEMLRGAIDSLNEGRKESQKIADELGDSEAKISKVTEDQREELDKADVSQGNYFHNLINNARNAVDASAQLAKALMDARKEAFEQADSKNFSIASGEIEAMEQRGVISHASAVKMKEQIDEEYHQRKVAMMIAEDKLEAVQAQLQLANKKIAAQTDARTVDAAETNYKAALGEKTKNDTRLSEAHGQIDESNVVLKELRGKGITPETVEQFKEDYEKNTGKSSANVSLPDMFTELARKRLTSGGLSADQSTLDILKADSGYGDRDLSCGGFRRTLPKFSDGKSGKIPYGIAC